MTDLQGGTNLRKERVTKESNREKRLSTFKRCELGRTYDMGGKYSKEDGGLGPSPIERGERGRVIKNGQN